LNDIPQTVHVFFLCVCTEEEKNEKIKWNEFHVPEINHFQRIYGCWYPRQFSKPLYGYLIYLLVDKDNLLSGTDSLVLDSIANELAIEGGEGVYMARAILNLELDNNISAPLYRMEETDFNTELIESRLYPNPNNGSFTYEYKVSDSCCYEVTLMDMGSRIIKIIRLEGGSGCIGISSLRDNGIYFLVLRRENEIIDWKKIIVVK
jgi:hypothetical protein